MTCYWVGMSGLIVGIFALPPLWQPLLWGGVGLLSAAGIVTGVMRHGPRRLWPWGLMAAGVLISTTGDVLYFLVRDPSSTAMTSVADLLYLAMFPVTTAGLLQLGRSGSVSRDRAGLVDTFTVTLVLALLAWVGWAEPHMTSMSSLDETVLAVFPMGDALLLAAGVRLLMARRRTPAIALIVAGTAFRLLADVFYALTIATGPWESGTPADLGWLAFYAMWGAAGLHPSMARLTEPEALPDRELTARHLLVLILTSLAAPTLLLVEAVTGEVEHGVLIALVSSTVFLLNLWRLIDAANNHRRSLVHRGHHDTLTGLANRALFSDRLAAATEQSRTGGPTVGVLVIDIDEFRLLNDTMGQSVGDEVLGEVAGRLSRILGRHDLAARFGGDEFAILVLLPRPDDVETFAARAGATLAVPILFAGREIVVTASIGAATTADAGSPADLLGGADLALQAARAAGRGQWRRYRAELLGPMVERMRLRTELDRAVAAGSFVLEYQPIVALSSGATVGLEALIRWRHPTRGLLPPEEFIQLAEEIGQIEAIGGFVLRSAVTAAAHWHRTRPPGPYVSVNVSARQFRTPGFAERVDHELVAAELPPDHLMLELTESVLLREEDQVWAELAALSDSGVRLAIDDFGTGFSSLSYLLQTPIDVIKVDKSFVGTLTTSERQRTLVAGIVGLARTLGLQVIAEGIETVADRDLLAEMGCPYGQGYLYSVPLASADVDGWLAGTTRRPAIPTQSDGTADEYPHSRATPGPHGTLPT